MERKIRNTHILIFYNTLFNAFDKSIRLVNNTNSYHKASQTPWITKGILTSKWIKNKLYKKYIDDPTEVNEKTYKRFRNRFNGIKTMAKKLTTVTNLMS